MQRELKLDARCPACGRVGLDLHTMTQDMPYFGEVLLTTVQCEKCGFKHADTMVMTQREAKRSTFRIQGSEDMAVRVVRSHSGTYRIPELGFSAEPGEGSESFVTNVEGLLERVREVILRTRLSLEEPAKQQRAEQLLDQLQRIIDGKESATIILEDPFGNSSVLSDRSREEKLSPEEIEQLRTGMILIDAKDLEP